MTVLQFPGKSHILAVAHQHLAARFVSTADLSPLGRRFVAREEGMRFKAYPDSRGILTIGLGHTLNGPSHIVFDKSTVWTATQCLDVFEKDAAPFVFALNRDLERACQQHQFDAMFSLEYNIGMAGMAKSTVVKDFNAGDMEACAAAFELWSHPAALEGRRQREAHLFLTGDYGNV